MNDNTLIKIALLRYVLIPRQLIAFDEAYDKDSYEFNKYFQFHTDECVSAVISFLNKIELGCEKLSYIEKCESILNFCNALPFLDSSSFLDLSDYNPFNDFDPREVDLYFYGKHFPAELNHNDDEASIFYAGNIKPFYQWYNDLKDKSLIGLLRNYESLLINIRTKTE